MSDQYGYSWHDTPDSRRTRRFHEISQGAKKGSLGALLERLRSPGGAGGSGDSPGLIGGAIETLRDAPRILSEWNDRRMQRREERTGGREAEEPEPRGPKYGVSAEKGEFPRSGATYRLEMQRMLDEMPPDEWQAINEYVDANPTTTRALQQAAMNSDWYTFTKELESLRGALGMGGGNGS